MAVAATGEITGLLKDWAGGNGYAFERLTALVYDELLRIARRNIRQRKPQTLETKVLAHEAYLRLAAAEGLSWQDRAHFFAVAAQMMRRILVDAARARAAHKRGGMLRVTLNESIRIPGRQDANLLAVHEALTSLAKLDPRKARVVELRFFGGLTVGETAEALRISPQTVLRDWRLAKPWLAREVTRREPHDA